MNDQRNEDAGRGATALVEAILLVSPRPVTLSALLSETLH